MMAFVDATSPAGEPELELFGHASRSASGRRSSRPEAVLGEQPCDGGAARGHLGPAHRTGAARTSVEVSREHVCEKPGLTESCVPLAADRKRRMRHDELTLRRPFARRAAHDRFGRASFRRRTARRRSTARSSSASTSSGCSRTFSKLSAGVAIRPSRSPRFQQAHVARGRSGRVDCGPRSDYPSP
jgi:hypothetical protein